MSGPIISSHTNNSTINLGEKEGAWKLLWLGLEEKTEFWPTLLN